MQDYITITGLELYAYHGVYEEEAAQGQVFTLNARLYYDMKRAGSSDDLSDAVNYGTCCKCMAEHFTQHRFVLIEAAAEHVCQALLREFSALTAVDLEVCKPQAPIAYSFSNVSVTIHRAWHTAYLGIGSNMGDRQAYLDGAVATLRAHPAIRDVRASDWITTKPYGPVEQEDFLNGCIALSTLLDPEELLSVLHGIEQEAGRTREVHWGPRTLDLDILFYDRLVYESDTLVIPHVDVANRRFVLEPLAQLAPNLRHPITGLTVTQMLTALD